MPWTTTSRRWRAAAGESLQVSVILPCLNEAETMATCVDQGAWRPCSASACAARWWWSTTARPTARPRSQRAAGRAWCMRQRRGYGSALMRGAEEARAPFIIMADADDSYDLTDLERFVRRPARRQRPGHGHPHPRHHRARRHAVAAPLGRQSDPHRPAEPALSAPASPTPTAACAPSPRTPTGACSCRPPAWSSPPR